MRSTKSASSRVSFPSNRRAVRSSEFGSGHQEAVLRRALNRVAECPDASIGAILAKVVSLAHNDVLLLTRAPQCKTRRPAVTTLSITRVVPVKTAMWRQPMRRIAVGEVPSPSAAIATSSPQLEIVTSAVLVGL